MGTPFHMRIVVVGGTFNSINFHLKPFISVEFGNLELYLFLYNWFLFYSRDLEVWAGFMLELFFYAFELEQQN